MDWPVGWDGPQTLSIKGVWWLLRLEAGGATRIVYTGPQWPPPLGLLRDQDPVQSKAELRVSSMSGKLDQF